jgi:hypothetical protein
VDSYSEDFNDPPAYVNIRFIEKFCVKYIPESIELISFIRKKYEIYKASNKNDEQNKSKILLISTDSIFINFNQFRQRI